MVEFPCLPSGDPLPLGFRWLRAHGLRSLTPWHFYENETAMQACRESYQKHTGKDAWPFAHAQDRMEVAAFALRHGKTDGSVVIIDTDVFDTMGGKSHGTIHTYASFAAWFKSAMRETEDWMTEEELAAILDD